MIFDIDAYPVVDAVRMQSHLRSAAGELEGILQNILQCRRHELAVDVDRQPGVHGRSMERDVPGVGMEGRENLEVDHQVGYRHGAPPRRKRGDEHFSEAVVDDRAHSDEPAAQHCAGAACEWHPARLDSIDDPGGGMDVIAQFVGHHAKLVVKRLPLRVCHQRRAPHVQLSDAVDDGDVQPAIETARFLPRERDAPFRRDIGDGLTQSAKPVHDLVDAESQFRQFACAVRRGAAGLGLRWRGAVGRNPDGFPFRTFTIRLASERCDQLIDEMRNPGFDVSFGRLVHGSQRHLVLATPDEFTPAADEKLSEHVVAF